MSSNLLTSKIGQRISLPGHFDVTGFWKMLDHAKREIVAARFYEIPAEAVQYASSQQMR